MIAAPAESPFHAAAPGEAIRRIADDLWSELLRHSPELATAVGARTADALLDDLSRAESKRHDEVMAKLARQLTRVDNRHLEPSLRILHDVVAKAISTERLRHKSRAWLWQRMDPVRGPLVLLQPLGALAHTLRSPQDAQTLVERLRALPTQLAQLTENLSAGVKKRLVPPKAVVQGAIAQLDALAPADAARSALLAALGGAPDTFDALARERAADALAQALAHEALPALQQFRAFLETLPTRPSLGLCAVKGGDKLYARELAIHTDGSLTPEQLHEVGLEEVRRLEQELLGLGGQLALARRATPQEVLEELSALEERPWTDDAERGRAATAAFEEAATWLAPLWGFFPAQLLPLRLERVDAPGEGVRYLPGAPDGSRPALLVVKRDCRRGDLRCAVHHAFTHHLQACAAAHLTSLPPIVQHTASVATTEGGALYSERLLLESGRLTTPLQRARALQRQLLTAAYAVVDTGLHALGWKKDQALRYLQEKTGLPQGRLQQALLRCAARPAHGLGYLLGSRELIRLRGRAQDALGRRFELPRFHRALLTAVSAPMHTLESVVDAHIAERRR